MAKDANVKEQRQSTKRTDYLEWQEYFMSIAFLSAQRSKDPRTQVGACIVNKENKIVGIGYNGMPMGCSDDIMPWNRAADKSHDNWLDSKAPYVCHAELNAVLNKNLADIKGCIIYVALFPCNMCAQIIIQSGIKEVVFFSDKYHSRAEFVASRRMMDCAGVKYRQFRPRQKTVVIDFEKIEDTAGEVPTLTSHNGSCGDTGKADSANNNNTSFRKCVSIGDHVEQEILQQIQNLPPPLEEPLSAIQHLYTAQGMDPVEFNFAIFSLSFLFVLVLFTWFLAQS